MSHRTRKQKPSEITDEFWVWAENPDQHAGYGGGEDTSTGKWLVFVPADQVDDWWDRIEDAVERGELGGVAKAATARKSRLQRDARRRVICVYTRDWRDKDDVARVLAGLRDLGVTWRLAYKTDSATIAGQYGDGSAIYVSPPGAASFEDRSAES